MREFNTIHFVLGFNLVLGFLLILIAHTPGIQGALPLPKASFEVPKQSVSPDEVQKQSYEGGGETEGEKCSIQGQSCRNISCCPNSVCYNYNKQCGPYLDG